MCIDNLDWDLYFETLEILENHKIKKTQNRSNVTGISKLTQWGNKKNTNLYDKVGFPMESQNFGMVMKRFSTENPFQEGSNNKKYPKVYSHLKKLINIIDPEFQYNAITLNHNFKCLAHFDKANKSPSIIIALGDFTGGELVVEGCPIDIHWNPLIMNGSTCKHWTNEFVGDRYTIIYYNI
tara:strand:- start:1470 stop:2012 length:543 start_codon:yes stop_codon:yes gene_type:complete